MEIKNFTRRNFVMSGAAAGAGFVFFGCSKKEGSKDNGENIVPTEDLMREHGAISRILLIYDEILVRLASGTDFPVETLNKAVNIFREFAEDYHEKLEEDYIFPRFEKANKYADIVKVLRTQHDTGRHISSEISKRAVTSAIKNPDERNMLSLYILSFNRMYRPHKAWEDTIIFPAFRTLVGKDEFEDMGEEFEKKENQKFGDKGFEKIVSQIADLEKTLNLNDLSKFTPGT